MVTRRLPRERLVVGGLLALALLAAAVAVRDQWRESGRSSPGFMVLENLHVAPGGAERGDLQPWDRILAVDGQPIGSARELQAIVQQRQAATPLTYTIARGDRVVDVVIPTAMVPTWYFDLYLADSLLPALLFLALGAFVMFARPGVGESRLFFVFCLVWFVTALTYVDFNSTHRFTPLFLTAWSFSPAVFLHLAFTFPERRAIARRFPGVVWLPYVLAAALALPSQIFFHSGAPFWAALTAGYWWGVALLLPVGDESTARAAWRASRATSSGGRAHAAGFGAS